MDPKMDLGFGLGAEDGEQGVACEGAANYDNLLDILQQMFVLEVGFIDGAALLESTHLCKYLWLEEYEKRAAIRDLGDECGSILNLYCFSLKKSMEEYSGAVLASNIFEEEDFIPTHMHILGTGDTMEAEVHADTETVYESLRDNKSDPAKAKIIVFMQYRQRFYELMFSVHRWCKELVDINTKYNRSSSKGDVSDIKIEIFSVLFQEVSPIITTTASLLEVVKKIFAVDATEGASSPPLKADKADALVFCMAPDKPSTRLDAFSSIRSKILSTSGLRAIKFKSAMQSAEQVSRIVTELSAICSMVQRYKKGCTAEPPDDIDYPSLLRELLLMSSQRYHLLSRSFGYAVLRVMLMDTPMVLYRCLQRRSMSASELDLVFGDPSLLQHLSSVCISTVDMLFIYRNKIVGKIIGVQEAWLGLIDAVINDTPGAEQSTFFYWLIHCMSVIMELHAQLTFESNVLYKKEVPFIYWYWYYAYSCQLHAIQQLRRTSTTRGLYLEMEEQFARGRRLLLKGLFENCYIYRAIDVKRGSSGADDNAFFISPQLFFRQRLRNFIILSDSFHPSLKFYEDKVFRDVPTDNPALVALARDVGTLFGQARNLFDAVRKAIVAAGNNIPIDANMKNGLLHSECVASLKTCIALSVNNIGTVTALCEGDVSSYSFEKYDDCTYMLNVKK